MIRIGHPFIEKKEATTYLKADIEFDNKIFPLWYSVDNVFGEFLCSDYADAFVLAVLMLAMKSGQDIAVEAPVSSKLLFNLNKTVQPIYAKQNPELRQVTIKSHPDPHIAYNGSGLGCCCSLGIDSFASFLQHYGPDVPEEYRVTHLTLFNSGQLGYKDVEGTRRFFNETIQNLQEFSHEVNLPILAVDSNINELYFDSGFTIVQTVLLRTISCALTLQKLFSKYVFASSYSIEYFKLDTNDDAYAQVAYASSLSTNNMEIIFSSPAMTRVEKTEFISQYPITTKYLDVCWSGQWALGDVQSDKYFKEKKHKNCGKCDKCLRTILALDLLGKLDEYENLFDLDFYRNNKDHFIAKVLAFRKSNAFYSELYDLMNEKGVKPTMFARLLSIKKKSMFFSRLYHMFRK